MARYFFHFQTGRTFTRDDEGVEITDPAHVRAHAADLVRRLIAETDAPGTWARSAFAVMDGEHRLVLHLSFASVLGQRAGPRPLLH
ncbi:DUF6894 family protein [Methylobacterium oxalidis]|uniref:DUF6894 domain-containing protein n=1 Tax=Methylobacterium oxalidis TaxID=944322 RepID=A0A512J3M4_9HYPH|nr:hypothetical protein [Methylobacterium oxalidis]GEP04556.1 hypothetical protein MOX02_25940 [Methylobacterium oxalidis]GJE33420.1 hypothetical protein LDDCCGHA_3620 [Methylobacterium oxalidis]GLS64835.1 hypothetical protein GCM10007888_32160 [Methylobacterium oxalidis]